MSIQSKDEAIIAHADDVMSRATTEEDVDRVEQSALWKMRADAIARISSSRSIAPTIRGASPATQEIRPIMNTTTTTKPAATDVLTQEEKAFCERYSISEDAFRATRKQELAAKASREVHMASGRAPAAVTPKVEIVLTKDDEEAVRMHARNFGISVDEARKQVVATKQRQAEIAAEARS